MRRIERRWSTPFGRWIAGYTVGAVVRDLGVTPMSVYDWLSGRSAPHPTRASAIVRISSGRLTLDDVYGHRDSVDRS